MGCVAPVYRPRDAEHTVLHQVIAEHLEAFLAAVAAAGDGAGLPQFVEREFREFLTCGVFEGGVARFRCEGFACEHLAPYRLRYQMAWNHGLSRAVLWVYTRVPLEAYARGAREQHRILHRTCDLEA